MKTEMISRFWGALPLAVLFLSGPTQAHHSTAAEFDPSKPVTFTGTVQKVMWMNPHIYTHIEVKQQGAPTMVYHVEGGAPNALFRQGWRKDSLKVGDTVTVKAWRAKNPDSPNVGQATITAVDGHKIFTGDGPAKVSGD
jgi:Family of unknown function (DUF6152)